MISDYGARMRQEWSPDELGAAWTLVDQDWPLVGNKTGAARLGFSVLLKYFEIEARFPQHAGDVSPPAAAYLAELQSCLMHVNTRLLQRVLDDPDWAARLEVDDQRGLTPLFRSNINPYGRFSLDVNTRLDLAATPTASRKRIPPGSRRAFRRVCVCCRVCPP